jgi:hypothetical protein
MLFLLRVLEGRFIGLPGAAGGPTHGPQPLTPQNPRPEKNQRQPPGCQPLYFYSSHGFTLFGPCRFLDNLMQRILHDALGPGPDKAGNQHAHLGLVHHHLHGKPVRLV